MPKGKTKIILISGKAEHGKTTLGILLKTSLESYKEKQVVLMNYADILKNIAKEHFLWDGNKDEEGRTLLQMIGAVARRKNPDVWVDLLKAQVEGVIIPVVHPDYIIIADTRYRNEIEAWENNDDYEVITIRVTRPGFENSLTETQRSNPSETELDEYPFTIYVQAEGMEELAKKALELIKEGMI